MLHNVKVGKTLRSVSIVGVGATPFFSAVEPGVAEKLGYEYSFEEEQSCMEFLEHVRNMPEDADEF